MKWRKNRHKFLNKKNTIQSSSVWDDDVNLSLVKIKLCPDSHSPVNFGSVWNFMSLRSPPSFKRDLYVIFSLSLFYFFLVRILIFELLECSNLIGNSTEISAALFLSFLKLGLGFYVHNNGDYAMTASLLYSLMLSISNCEEIDRFCIVILARLNISHTPLPLLIRF